MYCTIGGFTLDDTVLPTGEVRWAAPGGNALYSAVGARLWNGDVGIVARVGPDYPQAHLERLTTAGFDLSGVHRRPQPSFHVWILHEGDGRRQIVYRLDSGTNDHLDPSPEDIPSHFEAAQGIHICPIRNRSQAALVTHLAKRRVPLFLDLIVIPGQIELDHSTALEPWRRLRAFLPSLEEVKALYGDLPLAQLVACVQALPSEHFAIKMGHMGSLVSDPNQGNVYRVPAYPARVVDATGAGDAYCGGFMVGLQETGDPIEAAVWGTVAASFVIEDFGALHALDVPSTAANERRRELRRQVQPAFDLA
jgi:sugar/nucleoside kinase (ribokinase family)